MARERPILFSGPMVGAILAGTKTQTRRLISPQPSWKEGQGLTSAGWAWEQRAHLGVKLNAWHDCDAFARVLAMHCPYGRGGDRLWVREAWSTRLDRDHLKPTELDPKYDTPFFWADPETCNTGCAGAAGRKRASFHLPRWASRLTLEISEVRVQRLQEISAEDARAEGGHLGGPTIPNFYREAFQGLWDGINGKRAPWSRNPFVWAITFKRVA